MTTIKIEVKYGQSVDGYGWGRASVNGDRLHLISWDNDPYTWTTMCGKGSVHAPMQWASGNVCPACARAVGLKSAEQFSVEEDEYRWMQAQKKNDDD
jgi:hypothetical protein